MHATNEFLCRTAFNEQASAFLHSTDVPFDAVGARALLARSPWTNKQCFELYGKILAQLLMAAPADQDACNVEMDGTLLADYLNGFCLPIAPSGYASDEEHFAALAVQSMTTHDESDPCRQGLEFIRYYMREYLQKNAREHNKLFAKKEDHALAVVISSIRGENETHPAFRWALLSNAIDVHALFVAMEQDTVNPAVLLWETMAPLIVLGEWLPRREIECARLLYAHINATVNGNTSQLASPLLLRKVLDSNCISLHKSLECLFNCFNVSEAIVNAYFPLPLAQCHRSDVLKILLRIITNGDGFRSNMKDMFLSQLEAHHYMLAGSLLVHIAQSADAEAAIDTSDCLLNTFERIYGDSKPSEEENEEDPIDTRVFE